MNNQNQISDWLDKNLLRVERPGRYAGGEYNQIIKNWEEIPLHTALVFPDLYDLGISNLGITILYDEINKRTDALAERAYAPWLDMENLLRQDGIPLFSLENRKPLSEFDIVAFTLPYETLYTNALNILDLANIPILSRERNETHPLVIAGGHAVYNPEPLADFIDVFAIGEGEEIIHEILDVHKQWKSGGGTREDLLLQMSAIPGVYIPHFYSASYHEDGKFAELTPDRPGIPHKILKRILPILPPPPTRFLVPSIDVVHNRISVEIMRGCSRGCRFCHAGMVNRPVRERKASDIISAIHQSLTNTGFEEIALLSLSSSDYTQINELISGISRQYADQHIRISLPSLRIESFSVDIMEKLKETRSAGFTLAPEAATDRMRKTINKPLDIEQLLSTAEEIYQRGWPTLKLYFMIGHPNETIEDVQAIVDLCKSVRDIGFRTIGRRAKLNAGVSTFVPKPHTPFQWAACDTQESIREKQDLLRRELRGPGLKLSWTDPRETQLEAVLSRGDRRLSKVIYSAWKQGAKFDAWQDKTAFNAWDQAFVDNKIDPAFYSGRQRDLDEAFPWDHIDTGVKRKYLMQEYLNSRQEITSEDCATQCHACGIFSAFSELRKENSVDLWKCPDPIEWKEA
ncbi:MAG: TIGR03960 family B12-binding radical SAM protein [Chloroflexi bacterium]|nr:TIGR03960 family B12-binding radical SAM protein [Chloroflexota bacterium]